MVALRKSRKRHYSPRMVVGGVVVIVLVIAAAGWYFMGSRTDGNNNKNTPVYPGPTEEEQRAGDEQKDQIANDVPAQPETNSEGKQIVDVIITDASQYDDTVEVRAYVPNSYEEGSCTISFSKDGQQVQKTADAFVDSSYTICSRVVVPRSEFASSGTWVMTITYTSEQSYGTAKQNVEIL